MTLKLVSWKEKPHRTKDLDDIYEIINNYFKTAQDSFCKNHLGILDELNTDNFIIEAGAFMIGKEMGEMIKKESMLRTQILGMIQKEYFKDYEQIKRIFALIRKGLTD